MSKNIVRDLVGRIVLKKPEPIVMTPEQEEAVKQLSAQLYQLENNDRKEKLPFIDRVISIGNHKRVLVIIPLDSFDEYNNLDILDENYYKALHLKWVLEQCGCKFEEFHVRFSVKKSRPDYFGMFPFDTLIPEYDGDNKKVFLSNIVMHLDVKEALVVIDRSMNLPNGLPFNYGMSINAYEAA